jgi:hypothetical protein
MRMLIEHKMGVGGSNIKLRIHFKKELVELKSTYASKTKRKIRVYHCSIGEDVLKVCC